MRVCGHVSWVGKSSIEVTVWIDQMQSGIWVWLASAWFLMAARDPTMTGSAIVNKLVAATDMDTQMLKKGESKYENYKYKACIVFSVYMDYGNVVAFSTGTNSWSLRVSVASQFTVV